MLTVLGSLLGFAGSAVPSVIDYFKDKEEKNKKQKNLNFNYKQKKKVLI